jgi:putative addiction module killer protein
MNRVRLAEYLDARGNSPFGKWIDRLNREAAAEVTYALTRLEHGYRSNVKAVGGGINEYKITFGPGYRIYFGRDGNQLVILLGGGSKKRQSKDILQAKANWKAYKRRKQRGGPAWH